jgi:hypothetical protein
VPLNDEAIGLLNRWREQGSGGRRIFEVSTGFRTAWAKLLKRASITKFRWHDLRHHFASRLVQAGVPLNTVRDLLGHSSVAMSLRYAHLAPDQRREAVAKLNQKPLLALTLRLQPDRNSAVHFYPIELIGGERGTRTLDLGIMSTHWKIVLLFSISYRVAPVAIGTTEHNEAALGHAKLTQVSTGICAPRLSACDKSQIDYRSIYKRAKVPRVSPRSSAAFAFTLRLPSQCDGVENVPCRRGGWG